ncbi:MAG TPA: hypothetical protein VER11_01355 [Polyangiaceae bacterium]|nr:hypothetical protein [Polyangiaceae bacterium]
MAPPETPPGPEAQSQEILCVTRGEVVEVFRVRLLEGGAASLERYENGEFLPARVFSAALGEGASVPTPQAPDGAPLERAIRRALTYLDGSVSVGERDLLSPTSAMTRNLRWFPGDIQMLGTSFHYLRQLFPSAQFHVGQLFRRVFGDVAFLGLILFSSAGWLRTRGHAGLASLAFALQLASIVAIIGFDRFWEPIRYRFRRVRQVRTPNDGWRGALELVAIVLSQIIHGLAAVTINTLIGLTNLLIHPVKVAQSFQKVRRGKSLEWKASSVSAGQDMRGWPVSDFLHAYGFPAWVGMAMLFFLTWLVMLGAPLELFGLNCVGLFLASFLSAWFFAWHAALPHSAEDGAPRYQLSRGEFWGITLIGLAGVVLTLTLYCVGLYPMPSFESSAGVVALFLSVTCAFAALFPSYYSLKLRFAQSQRFRTSLRFRRASLWLALLGTLALVLALFGPQSLRERSKRFFIADKTRFRMSPGERQVYLGVSAALKRARVADPEPLLRASGNQLTLGPTARGPQVDARELRGLPSPPAKRLAFRNLPPITELYPPPAAERVPSNVPRRDFVLASGERPQLARPAPVERLNAVLEARRRARAMAPRVLSETELAEQAQFLAQADYPWISRAELETLGSSDARGARLPLIEMARVHRFDEIKSLWSAVPAAAEGEPSKGARFALLLDGIDGAVSLGLEPDAAHVQEFVALEREVAERWPREFPNVPLGAIRERLTGTPSNPFLVARYARLHGQSFAELTQKLRLDYVDWAWHQPPIAPGVRRAFRDRVEVEDRDRLELDWGESSEAKSRFEALQTEQRVATKILSTVEGSPASPEQLAQVLRLLEGAIGGASDAPLRGLAAALAQNFEIQGSTPSGDATDGASTLLRARLWTQTMSERVGQVAARTSAASPLPGSEPDQALLAKVSDLRFPDDAGDPVQRRALEWLVLIDARETYRELVDGYQHYQRELAGRGYANATLTVDPALSREQQWRDLFTVWRQLPERFPNLPARADQVAEFVCQTAYFSSADGKHPRTLESFLHDFEDLFADVNRLMPEAPPSLVQELTDAAMLKARGRLSRSPEARRFFAWWNVVVQARVVRYNFERRGVKRAVDPQQLARGWAEIVGSGLSRWPHLPWRVTGFSEYFSNLQQITGLGSATLWQRFERQLSHAESLSINHVAPAADFEALVERRIAERTGSPTFDPRTRRANAILALAELSDAASANRVPFGDANVTRLSALLARLYESVSRDYPNLYWEGEGTLESYTLLGLVNGWQPERTLREFAPEWSLANALAAGGMLQRLTAIAERESSELSTEDRALRTFIDTQALRVQKKTGLRPPSARSAAMNALVALSNLLLSAGEEGLLPIENGSAWSKQRVRDWALTLRGTPLAPATTAFAAQLGSEFGSLLASMRASGPLFSWEDGAFVETELLVAKSSGVSLEAMQAARRETWRMASELAGHGFRPPQPFVQLVARDAHAELAQKLATARGMTPDQVPEAELRAFDEPELQPQSAMLALSDVLAQVRIAHGGEPDPTGLAEAIVSTRKQGPERYPNVPWAAKGFVSSLLVAAQRPNFHGDVWRYAEFIDLPAVDRLLGEATSDAPSSAAGGARAFDARLPADVLEDMRAIMLQQTGRTPSSERVLAFQALHDGLFLVREFVPEVEPSLAAATALVQVRARVRALAKRFPTLHIVVGDDQSPRIGFADRLAAIATRQAVRSGLHIDAPSFADDATRLLESEFLHDLNHIYELVRRSFPTEELDYYKQAILRDALSDNAQKAKLNGLSASALSVPRIEDDDVVTDFALYELLYAREIGQSPAYVVDVFQIYDELRERADVRESYRHGLSLLDREGLALRAASTDEMTWRSSPEYAAWWEKRGDFVKRSRGKLLSLSRTFALLKEAAFSPRATTQARAAFARFGSFERYLSRFFDDLTLVHATPGIENALTELGERDQFLADGVEFAITQFKLHVLDRVYPSPARNAEVMEKLADFLPKVREDYRAALGFTPGLESGVPFYDSLSSFVRADVQATAGTDVLRRLNVVQRGLQSWTQTYFLKQAYKILFDRDLDEDDPAPIPTESRARPFVTRTVGDATHEFLEAKLPERLARETNSHDLVTWINWLMANGELLLDGQPSGKNTYAELITSYEQRLADYRERIRLGEASGKNVRAERQRVRDIEREYSSLQHRVRSLQTDAAAQAAFYARATRDYREAIWQSALWLLALGVCGILAWRWAPRIAGVQNPGRGWLAIASFVGTCALGVVPFWVAGNPERAERFASRPLYALRLLDRGDGETPRARGMAAQLDRTRPWTVLATSARKPR